MTINNTKDPYIEPSADVWELINRKAEESKDEVFLFILHCLRKILFFIHQVQQPLSTCGPQAY